MQSAVSCCCCYGHSASVIDGQVYLFGGTVTHSPSHFTSVNHLLRFSPATRLQTEVVASSGIPPFIRNFHTAVVQNSDSLIVFGGKNHTMFNDCHKYCVATNAWSELHTVLPPSPRYGHVAVIRGNEMIVHGGYDTSGYACADFYSLNLLTNHWRRLELRGDKISARYFHTASILGDMIIIYGGTDEQQRVMNDLFVINMVNFTCHMINMNTNGIKVAEDGRFGHVCELSSGCSDGVVLSVFGGRARHQHYFRGSISIQIDFNTFSATTELITSSQLFSPFDGCTTFPSFGSLVVLNNQFIFHGGKPVVATEDYNQNQQQINVNMLTTKWGLRRRRHRTSIDELPEEVIKRVYDYLDFKTICNLSSVSNNSPLFQLSNQNQYWSLKYHQVFGRIDYYDLAPLIYLNESTTSYRTSLVELVTRSSLLNYHMNVKKGEILKIMKRSSRRLIDTMGYTHAYLGVQNLRYLFLGIHDAQTLHNTFFTMGVLKTNYFYNYQTHNQLGVKCVLIGERNVGKSSLLRATSLALDTKANCQSMSDAQTYNYRYCGNCYALTYWRTAASDEYYPLRPVAYSQTNIFVFCFSLVNPYSLECIKSSYYPEIVRSYPDAAYILIGTKKDQRDLAVVNSDANVVHCRQGEAVAKSLGCLFYLEISKTDGVKELPEMLIQTSIIHKVIHAKPSAMMNHSSCAIL